MEHNRYSVFLSHNSANQAAVEVIARRLREEARLEPFLDTWHLVPGEPWQEALERALDASQTCAVFLGPQGLGTWDNEAMRAALDIRAGAPDFRVIPVLLPGAHLPERGRLPRFLARLTWVDFRAGLDDAHAFHELVCGIQGLAPGPERTTGDPAVCPFRGLQVFEEEHADLFFGREALTQHLVEQLRADRFLAVIGPSGSGKSSLVRAGLVPQVRKGALPGSDGWPIMLLKPGPHPLEMLATRLLPHLGNNADPIAARQSLLGTLERDERGLHSAVQVALAAASDSGRVLLIVDQFEELFTLCRDDAERQRFIANLLYASAIAGGQTIAIITMRADFFGKCATYPDLAARVAERDVLVGPMDAEDLRRTMLGPAEQVGLNYEKGLVETILDDLGSEPGELPLLEHTLLELWEQRRGDWLTTDVYHAIGGVQGALAQRADALYARLTPAQEAAARRVLLRLTQPGEGTEDTRRRAPLTELLPAGAGAADVEAVVRELADARLLTTSTDERGAEVVDVAHEALIRGWPLLQGWIDEDRDALRTQRRLTEVAAEWAANNRDASYLYRGARLSEAQEWAMRTDDMNELERAFLDASVTARETERRTARRRVRRTIGGLAGALAVISALAIVAFLFYRDAESQRAQLMLELGRREAGDRPLYGLRLMIEALTLTPAGEASARLDIAQAAAEQAKLGRVAQISHNADNIYVAPGGAVFVLDQVGGAKGELRRTGDGALLSELAGNVSAVFFDSKGTAFVVDYVDAPTELRQADGTAVQLPGHILPRQGEGQYPGSVTFSADGKAVVLVYLNTRAELRRTDGSAVIPLTGVGTTFPGSVVFSPDGSTFVVSYAGEPAELRRSDGTLVATLGGGIASYPGSVAFSPDGTVVLAAYKTFAELRRTDNGAVVSQLPGGFWQVAFSPDGTSFVINYREAEVPDELRLMNGSAPVPLPDNLEGFGNVTFSPYGSAFVADYDTAPDELRRSDGSAIPLTGEVQQATFSPDGALVVIAYEQGPGELRPSDGGAPIQLAGEVQQATFSPDGAFVVIGYDEAPGELRRSGGALIPLTGQVRQVMFSPDKTVFAVDYADAPSELYKADGSKMMVLAGHIADRGLSFSRDGTAFAVIYDDAPGELWDRQGEPRRLSVLGPGMASAAFAPKGDRLVVRYVTGEAYLLDIAWLRAMGGDPARLPEADLVRLACQGPLAGGLWTTKDQADLEHALGSRAPRACG